MIKSTFGRSGAPAKLFLAAVALSLVAAIAACNEAPNAADENAGGEQAAAPGTPGAAKTCAELNPSECAKPGVRVRLLSGAADPYDIKFGCVAGNAGKCVRYEPGPPPGSIKYCKDLSATYCKSYPAGSLALAKGVDELNCTQNPWFKDFTCGNTTQAQTRPPCAVAALASCSESSEGGCRAPVPGEMPDDECTTAPVPVQVTTVAAAAGLSVPCTDITQIGDLCAGKTADPTARAGNYFSVGATTRCLFVDKKCIAKPTSCDSASPTGLQTAGFGVAGAASVVAFENACRTLDLFTPGIFSCDYTPHAADPINQFGTCVAKTCAKVNSTAAFIAAANDAERKNLCDAAAAAVGSPCRKSNALDGTKVVCVDEGRETEASDAIATGGVSSCSDLKAAVCDDVVSATPKAVIEDPAAPGAVTIGANTAAVCVQPPGGGATCVAALEKPIAVATCVPIAPGDPTLFAQVDEMCASVAEKNNVTVTAANPGANILGKSTADCSANYDLRDPSYNLLCGDDDGTKFCKRGKNSEVDALGKLMCGNDVRKQPVADFTTKWELVSAFPAPGTPGNKCENGALQMDFIVHNYYWAFPAPGTLTLKSNKKPGDKTGCTLR